MQQTGFLPVAKRWWWAVALAGFVAGATAYIVANRIAPTYEAQVTLLTGPINTDFGTIRASGDLARTYAELATSGPLLTGTSKRLRLGVDARDLRRTVTATSNDVTRLVRIRVKHGNPARAAAIANEIARRLTALTQRATPESVEIAERLLEDPRVATLSPETRERIETAAKRLLEPPAEGRLVIVDPAAPPVEPVAPRVSLITLLALLAGVAGATILVLLAEFAFDRIDDEERFAALAQIPLLGKIGGPRRRLGSSEQGLVVEHSPRSASARDYRLLATRIGLLDAEETPRTLLVVGAEGRAGSGAVAANLAALLAQKDERVILVDADDMRSEVTRLLGLNGEPGYSELIAMNGAVPDFLDIGVTRSDGFVVLPSGEGSSEGLLNVDHARRVLQLLLNHTDRVVLNAPTLGESPTALVWAHVADATVLVARRGRSKRDAVTDAVQALRLAGAHVAGAVFREGRAFGAR